MRLWYHLSETTALVLFVLVLLIGGTIGLAEKALTRPRPPQP